MRYDTLILEPLRDMTGQVASFIPTLLIGFGILAIGWIIARLLRDGITRLFEAIEFDKVSDTLGVTKVLKNGGLRHKPSALVGCMIYCVFMIMVFIITIQALGLHVGSSMLDSLFAYVPSVISGVLVLIIGMYLARFVSVIVYLAAKNTDMPSPALLSRLTKLAIMVYVGIIFLKEIGFVSLFVGTHYTIFITGIVFAFSFGIRFRWKRCSF